MPCSDWRDDVRIEYVYKEDHKKVDAYAQKLCRIYTIVEKRGMDHLIPIQDREWWEKHKKWDIERKAQEKKALIARRDKLKKELADVERKI